LLIDHHSLPKKIRALRIECPLISPRAPEVQSNWVDFGC
jgi:hypothetical protein